MKQKKSLINTVVIWSIFFVFSISYGWIISLQDSSLNKFWEVKKLNSSIINNTYADDDNEYDDDDYRVVKKVNVISPVINEPTSSVNSTELAKSIILDSSEKIKAKIVFNNFLNKINKITSSDSRKLKIFERLNTLLDEKILTLELIKSKIKDTTLLDKYEKKILLFSEVNGFVQEKILVYIDSIDLVLEKPNITTSNNTNTTSVNTVSNNSTVVDTNATAAKLAADKANAAKVAAANAASAKLAAAKVAAAKVAAAKTAAANAAAAKLAAEKAAAAKLAAEKAAAAKAAAASVNTTTTAS